ncbi:UNKNOWN [Stylonychia lemnae]|uniref:RCC1-like domain-containing protein n=1 Tax=Stylonychia lemnae TaxID=5949 RepID=A0A078A3A3_STYLE|nr:UNKNOWN [Stylonychia lemnae]|eukprot:CDW75988.1 UNKNOWN [Stylonychia lemnae]
MESSSQSSNQLELYSWGLNKGGQLGIGQTKARCEMLPKKVKLQNPADVSTFSNSSICVTKSGKIFGWGNNQKNRLGNFSGGDNSASPVEIKLTQKIIQVSCGQYHSLLLTHDGLCLSAGQNKSGELGREGSDASFDFIDCKLPLRSVEAGFSVSFYITIENQLLTSGKKSLNTLNKDIKIPSLVKFFSNGVHQIQCGYNHVGCIDQINDLYMWGNNQNSKLGVRSKAEFVDQPTLVKYLKEKDVKISQVSCTMGERHGHTGCVSVDGRAFFWGDPYKGKLGNLQAGWTHEKEDNEDVENPFELDLSTIGKAKKVLCAGIHSGLLTEDGKLYTFGCGSDGRLGHPDYEGSTYLYKESIPKLVEFFNEYFIEDVTSSYYWNYAIVRKL